MKNKKLFTLFLIIAMCAMLFGCGKSKEEKIEEALQGTWCTSTDDILGTQFFYNFNEGHFEIGLRLNENEEVVNEGTYEIGESNIILKFEQGEKGEDTLNYSFEEDVLILLDEEFGQIHNMNEN